MVGHYYWNFSQMRKRSWSSQAEETWCQFGSVRHPNSCFFHSGSLSLEQVPVSLEPMHLWPWASQPRPSLVELCYSSWGRVAAHCSASSSHSEPGCAGHCHWMVVVTEGPSGPALPSRSLALFCFFSLWTRLDEGAWKLPLPQAGVQGRIWFIFLSN